MAYGLLQSLLPCTWFKFWPGYIGYLSVLVSPPPPFQTTWRPIISSSFSRISTQILSHFVEDFTLVSAFFLFVLGCLNILLGLTFLESAKAKRSISSWRAVEGVLPTFQDNRLPVFINNSSESPSNITPYFMRQDMTASDNGPRTRRSTEKSGYQPWVPDTSTGAAAARFRPVTPCQLEFKLNTAKMATLLVWQAVFQFLFPHYFSLKKGHQSVIVSTTTSSNRILYMVAGICKKNDLFRRRNLKW